VVSRRRKPLPVWNLNWSWSAAGSGWLRNRSRLVALRFDSNKRGAVEHHSHGGGRSCTANGDATCDSFVYHSAMIDRNSVKGRTSRAGGKTNDMPTSIRPACAGLALAAMIAMPALADGLKDENRADRQIAHRHRDQPGRRRVLVDRNL